MQFYATTADSVSYKHAKTIAGYVYIERVQYYELMNVFFDLSCTLNMQVIITCVSSYTL
jgi:hypothetical protein